MKIKEYIHPTFRIHRELTKLFFAIKTRTYKHRIKYIYEKSGSKQLVISFTAFSEKPCYNYYRTLKPCKCDKLFLQDNFGYRGSYLLYENGTDLPYRLTSELLGNIIKKGNYLKIIMLGSSKGGADSIIFGLELGASEIFSGANQYYLGKYLNTEDDNRKLIFKAMMGENAGKKEQEVLDSVMPNILKKHKDSRSHIHILYSKEEHTYEDHIKFMIEDLKKTNIPFTEVVEHFDDHNEVGRYFSPYILKHIKQE